ncbi:MAG: TIGR02757 family protein [Spirochaetales bacterium]|nr:TIGR02757 family protein [Spirochaetales bacterium]
MRYKSRIYRILSGMFRVGITKPVMIETDKVNISNFLESIYDEYHHPAFIHPDPLEFLADYSDPLDREIVGLIASSFAIGRVTAILNVIKSILEELPSPRKNLLEMNREVFDEKFKGFRYRFYDSSSLVDFLWGIGRVIKSYDSLNECFLSGLQGDDLLSAMILFTGELCRDNRGSRSVLPSPSKGSACKRLNLYLRWMVRNDRIDPGGWMGVSPSILLVPLDTHMHRIGQILGFTDRKNGDLRAAMEITESLRQYAPADPVRYDFSLTRLGIHPLLNYSRLSEFSAARE